MQCPGISEEKSSYEVLPLEFRTKQLTEHPPRKKRRGLHPNKLVIDHVKVVDLKKNQRNVASLVRSRQGVLAPPICSTYGAPLKYMGHLKELFELPAHSSLTRCRQLSALFERGKQLCKANATIPKATQQVNSNDQELPPVEQARNENNDVKFDRQSMSINVEMGEAESTLIGQPILEQEVPMIELSSVYFYLKLFNPKEMAKMRIVTLRQDESQGPILLQPIRC
ncbi:hypothetical protein Ciccas_008195 [Cichlidogyrus casuarinus]|uniref:Uncharacterized protein n=1 Tax=Cichlidogyrus casuarinus TaxID=1844966 RepID=A0ABD2Q0N1_9PLAT